ncbi:hypothetical protein HK405_012888, partial [Cladochytrium tenue]
YHIVSGLDNRGRRHDADGVQRDWWDARTAAAFEAESQCVVEQYSNRTAVVLPDGTELRVNGTATRDDNAAWIAGLAAAHAAWQVERAAPGGGGKNPLLPGIEELADDQLFFVGFARQQCERQRASVARQLAAWAAPARVRVNGAVSNLDAFARAFSCPAGSPMNPRDKCRLW